MRHLLLTLTLVLLLCSSASSKPAAKKGKTKDAGKKLEAYQKAADTVAEHVNKATEKSEALINEHMSAVEKDPGALITQETMKKIMQGSSFLPQKAGTRSVVVQSEQGFNGVSNYQPASWKITETMSGPTDKKEPASESNQDPVFTYPAGLGPVLLNGCTGTNYSKTSPCYNSKLFDLQNTICTKQIDAANYIGVGFDGRGRYRSESRKASLIQRSCVNRATFMDQDVPDTMNVFGIFETTAETKSFQSVDNYMKYIRQMAGLSNQKNLFISEASKFSKASSFGANLGGIGAIVGGAIGAYAGGPVGAAMGASLGGAIGGSIGGGSGSGSGKSSATDKGKSSSSIKQTAESSGEQASTQNFFAIMYVNVILYEISLDEVKPTDISFAALRDYMSLPVSYYSIGADVKYQNFLLRWGTHFIRSAKFGGQLKVTKTSKLGKFSSEQDFASHAETEFQAMFSTLQSKWSQKSSSWGFLGFGGKKKSASQSSKAKSESGYTGTVNSKKQVAQNFRQSEFTQTSVEAQGGMPEIAEALVDFYTPAFKQLFHDWLVSIKDYAKPFEFQLRPVNELFNLNMDSLFPAGNTDFGCVGDSSKSVKILIDPKTKQRYYIDTVTAFGKNATKISQKIRVNCKYSEISDFKKDMQRRMVSLERAVGVYMAEGPFPTSSLELQGGQPGCEEATKAQFNLLGSSSAPLKFAQLLRQPFLIVFDLPEAIPDILTMQAKYTMVFRFNRWFAIEPNHEIMHLYDGCQVANTKATDKKVCFRNIILTYEESTGIFHIDKADFAASKLRIPTLPYWLAGSTVARSRRIAVGSSKSSESGRGAIPCHVKWRNAHRLDPAKNENCIHFTAASEGDLFVVFSSIPRDHSTWYYLQVSPEGVGFYHAMRLQKSDHRKGMGMLGDKNLFQSFFVCVTQKSGTVMMQYGKADPDSEVGTVYSSYKFPPDTQFSKLSFYSFGAGVKAVSLMDVRLTRKLPKVTCLGTDYVKKDGECVLVCHAECKGCRHAKNNKSCQQCKNARVETGSGAARVVECVAQCPPGKQLSKSKEKLCVPCEAGKFKAVAGNQACTLCSTGSSAPGATKCGPCPAGTIPSSNRKQCTRCPAGKFAAKGASSCSICPVGKFSAAGQSQCKPCPYGRYGRSRGMSSCTPCAAGYFAPRLGMTSCTRCPAGTSSKPGSRSCSNNCAKGQFSPRAGVACARCPAGRFSNRVGSTSCQLCPAGTYAPSTGSSVCTKCPAGHFASTKGSTKCQLCPQFTYSATTGASRCTNCPSKRLAKSDRKSCHQDYKLRLIGCYLDNARHDLPLLAASGNMAPTICYLKCKAKGFAYFGLQNYNYCYCGNSYGAYGRRSASECNRKCSGNQYKMCGGFMRNSVYATGITVKKPYNFLGCYMDSGNRDLTIHVRTGTMTHDICYNLCKSRSKPYFGVQNGNQCFCGDFYSRYGKRSIAECNSRCSGDSAQYCGAGYRNMIYQIHGVSVRRQITSYLYPSVRTGWGDWGSWHYCPAGYHVNRFQLRVERGQGRGDDTALNTVKMYCSRWPNHWDGNAIYSKTGYWGDWKSIQSCSGGFFNGIQLRSEPPQGKGDDTAANDMKMRCSNGRWNSGGGMGWGSWGSAKYCSSGSAICGIRTKVERPQGKGDDTALNVVQAACCKL